MISDKLFDAVRREAERQDELWGADREMPDGSGGEGSAFLRAVAQRLCEQATAAGTLSWSLILNEEVMEALAETDEELLVEELVQVATVALHWAESIRLRQRARVPPPSRQGGRGRRRVLSDSGNDSNGGDK